MTIAFWCVVALLAVSLVADAALWIAHRRRSRFRARWAGPAPAATLSLSERMVREQRVPGIVAVRPFVRADQRRAR